MTEKVNDGRTVQLKRVRLSFCDSLYQKKKTAKVEDAKESHSCNLIIESGSEHFDQNLKAIKNALNAACEVKWTGKPERWQQIAENDPKRVCFRRGERFRNQATGDIYDGYEGNLAIVGKGPRGGAMRPKLLDRHKRPVSEQDILEVMYAGSYCDAIVSFYATENGGLGVFCSIEAIRSHQEGDRMAGGVEVDPDVFDDLEDDDGFDMGESSIDNLGL